LVWGIQFSASVALEIVAPLVGTGTPSAANSLAHAGPGAGHKISLTTVSLTVKQVRLARYNIARGADTSDRLLAR
jgi:hypothetical protein